MTSPIPQPPATTPPPWHRLPPEQILTRLAATADGLTTAEAATRLTAQGPNTLQQRRKAHPIRILARQFQSIIVWVLIGAGVLSGFLGEWTDATAILVIVALNAVVGAWQEFKAEKSIEALQELNAPQARVQRDGKVTSIPATDVVTGEGYTPAGEVRLAGRALDPAQQTHLLELGKALVGGSLARLEPTAAAWKLVGDPTEGALFAAGLKAGANLEQLDRELPQALTLPFDSDRKRSSILRLQPDGQLRIFCNGAPGTVLSSCNRIAAHDGVRLLTDADRATILAQAGSLGDQALRVLASAQGVIAHRPPAELTPETVEKDLIYLGLAGMYDPPRPEAREAIEKCRSAGIRVIMITGDHPKTALAIARELGIDAAPAPVTGADLDRLSEPELKQKSATAAVYARVTAEHKLRIVRALRADGAVVAMTGDGVNDAPALQGADIGIALGRTGTEVTKQAADMVITDHNFATIVAAVEEGRGTYDNIRKTLQYLLAGNTGELLRSFGVRSATLPIWRIPLLTNPSLVIVVVASFALQIFSQHNDTVGRLLKTAPVPFATGLLYLAIGAIPLVLLELLKVLRKPTPPATP